MSGRLTPETAWPPTDRSGHKLPHRFNGLTWLKVLGPDLLRVFDKRVPDEMWSHDVDDDGDPIAVVACVCGAEPKLYYAAFSSCECDRWFFWVGKQIRVARLDNVSDS